MAYLHRSVASLRVMSDSLVAGEVSAMLGAEPDWFCAKGDQVHGEEAALTGIWSIKATDRKPEDLDGQVQEILGRLTPNLAVWVELGRQHKLNFFCGLFMRRDNEGFLISPPTLLSLGQRGIELDGDLYAP